MSRVVVPPSAGLFSSFGLLYADVEHHYSRTFRRLVRQADLAEIERAWMALADQARAQLASEGFAGDRLRIKRSAALHYQGQSYELAVPVPEGKIDEAMVQRLEEAFGQEHEKTYGHRAGPDEPVELVSIQIVGQGLREGGVPETAEAQPCRACADVAALGLFRRGRQRPHRGLGRDAGAAAIRSRGGAQRSADRRGI